MRAAYLREVIALLERAQQTEDPREASELLKQATDIMALVAELSAPSIDPDVRQTPARVVCVRARCVQPSKRMDGLRCVI